MAAPQVLTLEQLKRAKSVYAQHAKAVAGYSGRHVRLAAKTVAEIGQRTSWAAWLEAVRARLLQLS